MKCVCRVKCQQRNRNGRIMTFRVGDVYDFDECPTHFEPIEGDDALPLDFDTAQEQELLESDFDLDELRDYIMERYDRKPGNRGKEKLVEMLLDCRYREIDDPDLDRILD